jgi:hypothetical protein
VIPLASKFSKGYVFDFSTVSKRPADPRAAWMSSAVASVVFAIAVFPLKRAPLSVLAKPKISIDKKRYRDCTKQQQHSNVIKFNKPGRAISIQSFAGFDFVDGNYNHRRKAAKGGNAHHYNTEDHPARYMWLLWPVHRNT